MRAFAGRTYFQSVQSNGRNAAAGRTTNPSYAVALVTSLLLLSMPSLQAADAQRVTRDLQALYTFEAGSGDTIQDRSGVGQPLNLKIENSSTVQWQKGVLVVRSSTKISSPGPAKKITDALKQSNAVTIEAWVKPASDRQRGPARIVSLSAGIGQRNFTLGQDRRRFDVRLRTTSTNSNGIPSTAAPAGTAKTALTHLVYAREATGNTRFYVNGKHQAAQQVTGTLSGWSDTFRLSLANELTGDRPWLGELHLVAIYSQALTAEEILQNFAAGRASGAAPVAVAGADSSGPPRVVVGLAALYTFDSGSGDTVRDRSAGGQPLDLTIEEPSAVQWQEGALVVRSATKISSSRPAKKIIDAAKRSNATTLEAWVRPANDKQTGPARVVSLSADTGQRNVTLGQEARQFHTRLRTTATDSNGLPETATPSGTATTRLTHVVFTRDAADNARMYVNGKQQASKKVAGKLANWNGNFPLVLANEATGDRPWLGELYLVAIYSRGLSAGEVAQNFKAGVKPNAQATEQLAALLARQTFETKIAPLLARHCLECHDSASKKGGLDLSRKIAALAGGESGEVIVPGKAAESLLWEQVSSDEMPKETDPMSAQDKTLLREWIDAGAAWSLDLIDPAVYAHDESADKHWVRRLTVTEYIETVRGAVGVDISKEAREILPPDLRADGFSNTAYNLNVDLKHVEAYARLAEIIVGRMDVLKFATRFSESQLLSTDDTMRQFVEAMGKWLFRGPLEERQITNYSGIATTVASSGGDFKEAVSFIIEAMLQSPRFIYRIENQRGDGTAWPVGEHELASRLSYIIWGGPPDQELVRAAEAGELNDRGRLESQVQRMLQDLRAIDRSSQFIAEWLHLDRLDNMRPDLKRFPKWDAALAADMREETLAFFKDVVWKQNRPLADLFNAPFTYATPRLAEHYGFEPKGTGLSRYDLSSVPARGGLLTQGSALTVGGDDASMVTRGLFVLQDVLRGVVKDPPPSVDTTPIHSKPGLSQRHIAEQRMANVACAGCHSKFEPLAYGLERFDGLGAFHEEDEHGNTLRDDGEILFPGAAEPVKFQTSAELMQLLANSERVRKTITWKATQFALGRPLAAADARRIEKIHEAAQQGGGTYASLITAIVTSDLVMTTQTEKTQ